MFANQRGKEPIWIRQNAQLDCRQLLKEHPSRVSDTRKTLLLQEQRFPPREQVQLCIADTTCSLLRFLGAMRDEDA